MANATPLVLATIIHILFRISIFIEQPFNNCSVAPSLASFIYLVSTLMLIYDSPIYPRKYSNIPKPCQIFAEVIAILLLIEFSTMIIWCNLERTFHRLLKCILFEKSSNMYYDMGGDFLVGALLVFASAFICMNVALATDVYYTVRRKLMYVYRKIVDKIKKMWGHLPLCYEKKPVVCQPPSPEPADDPCRAQQARRRCSPNYYQACPRR